MIDSIIEALNESRTDGFYILHKSEKKSVIEAVKIIIYRLYFIDNSSNEGNQIFSYTRTVRKIDYNEEFKKNFDKEFIKNLTLAIIHRAL